MRTYPIYENGHLANCKMRLAFFGAAAIECEHGYDACPICDPCTCKDILEGKQKPFKRIRLGRKSYKWRR